LNDCESHSQVGKNLITTLRYRRDFIFKIEFDGVPQIIIKNLCLTDINSSTTTDDARLAEQYEV